MQPLSVLIAETNATLLKITARFLGEQFASDLTISGLASSDQEALALSLELQPQLILLGVSGWTPSGQSMVRELRALAPRAAIVVMGNSDIDGYQQAALAAGADAFLPKWSLKTGLLPIIQRLAAC